jgi:hypothetical protein
MASPDFICVLDDLPETAPSELLGRLEAAAGPLGATDVQLYLADFQGVALQPVLVGDGDRPSGAEEVAGTMAGRAFRSGLPVTAERAEGVAVWVPVVEQAERTGVLALTVPAADEEVVAQCVRLGRFAGLLVRAYTRTTDVFHLHRRRQAMTLAAGMQWDLLPALVVRGARAQACGRLEPAYEIAGDVFDYALNERSLEAGLFDAMGHGLASTLMTGLAVGAYRHGRRAKLPLDQLYGAIDEAVASHYRGEAFVTAALARLDVGDGTLTWLVAGHPQPLLLRPGAGVRQLEAAPSLPLGLGGPCRGQATEALQPGDSVLFYTDGVVDGRSPAGQPFGVEQLVERWEHHAASGLPAEEVLRGLVDDVLEHNGHRLRDDASLLLLGWMAAGSR